MKQVTLQFGSGLLAVKDVAPPLLRPGHVLVAARASLISTGTERTKLLTARRSLLGKARSRPDQVRQVLKKYREVGLAETLRVVRSRLGRDEPLGYSCAGEVIAVGTDVETLRVGDRVACAGAGYANHAEVIVVPKNLCVPIPENVSYEDAAFVTLGAIALHGVRQAEVSIGESALVVGLGLLGQLTVQLLAPICGKVVGTDLSSALCERALGSGASAAVPPGGALERSSKIATNGRGFDVAIVTAADLSGAAFQTAIGLLRDRGRVVIVGGVGVTVPNSIKSALYERELEVRFARSYGPGRYDEAYEEGGQDYPYGYVRWTEQRNMEAVLAQIDAGRVRPRNLVDRVFDIEHAEDAFALLDGGSGPIPLGVLLKYGSAIPERLRPIPKTERAVSGKVRVGVIGAGNFAQAHLLPPLKAAAGIEFAAISTASGLSADAVASRFGFQLVAASVEELLADESISAMLIATRHDSHADLTCRALLAGKDVFVEKPLALDWEELEQVRDARERSGKSVVVGFNRRFSESAGLVRKHMLGQGPLSMIYRVNAGSLGAESWYTSVRQGGGRFIGEGGHFLDLMCHVAGAQIAEISTLAPAEASESPKSQDSLVVNVRFTDGSVGVLCYLSQGDPKLPKERLEVFGAGRVAILDDFRVVELLGGPDSRRIKVSDGKGHKQEMEAWAKYLRGEHGLPVSEEDQLRVTAATLAAVESLSIGVPVSLS